MNAQLVLTTKTTAKFASLHRAADARRQPALQVIHKQKPKMQRKYEPLETDGPATCLVWFD